MVAIRKAFFPGNSSPLQWDLIIYTIVGFLPPFSWARSFYWFVSQFGQEGIMAQNDNDHHGENNDCVILMMMPRLYNLLRNLIRSLEEIGQ